MTLDELINGHYGTKGLDEVRYGGRVIWPPSYAFRFEVTAVRVSYPDGASQFPASGGTATIKGDVAVTQMGMVIKRYADVPLNVTVVEGGAAFSAGSAAGTVVAEHRGTVVGPRRSCAVSLTYSVPVESGTAEVIPYTATLWQAENGMRIAPGYTETLSLELLADLPVVGVQGNAVDLTCTHEYKEVAETFVYDSGARLDGDTKMNREYIMLDDADAVTIDPQGGITRSGNRLVVSSNAFNASERSWIIGVEYHGEWASVRITQMADSYTDEVRRYDYFARLALSGTNSVSAAGGSCGLLAYAGHTEEVIRHWAAGGSVSQGTDVVYEIPTLTKISDNNGRFSLTINSSTTNSTNATVTHGGMGSSVTTDTAVFRCTNRSDTSKYQDVTLSATNAVTSSNTTMTWDSISVSPDRAVSDLMPTAYTIWLTITKKYHYTTTTSYTSGTTTSTRSDVSENGSSNVTVNTSTNPGSGWCTYVANGNSPYVNVSANTFNYSRSATLTFTITGTSISTTLSLKQNTTFNLSYAYNSGRVTVTITNYSGSNVTIQNSNLFLYIQAEYWQDNEDNGYSLDAALTAWRSNGTKYTNGITYGGKVIAAYRNLYTLFTAANGGSNALASGRSVTITTDVGTQDASGYPYNNWSVIWVCMQASISGNPPQYYAY